MLHLYSCFVQCGSLLDKEKFDDFMEEINEEYEEIREEHYDSLKVIQSIL